MINNEIKWDNTKWEKMRLLKKRKMNWDQMTMKNREEYIWEEMRCDDIRWDKTELIENRWHRRED